MKSLLRNLLRNPNARAHLLQQMAPPPGQMVAASKPAPKVEQAEAYVKRTFEAVKVKVKGRLNAAARHAENEARQLMRRGVPMAQAIKMAAQKAVRPDTGMGCPARCQ